MVLVTPAQNYPSCLFFRLGFVDKVIHEERVGKVTLATPMSLATTWIATDSDCSHLCRTVSCVTSPAPSMKFKRFKTSEHSDTPPYTPLLIPMLSNSIMEVLSRILFFHPFHWNSLLSSVRSPAYDLSSIERGVSRRIQRILISSFGSSSSLYAKAAPLFFIYAPELLCKKIYLLVCTACPPHHLPRPGFI